MTQAGAKKKKWHNEIVRWINAQDETKVWCRCEERFDWCITGMPMWNESLKSIEGGER